MKNYMFCSYESNPCCIGKAISDNDLHSMSICSFFIFFPKEMRISSWLIRAARHENPCTSRMLKGSGGTVRLQRLHLLYHPNDREGRARDPVGHRDRNESCKQLRKDHPEKEIISLNPHMCPCLTMNGLIFLTCCGRLKTSRQAVSRIV